jgi:hypothetical protein
MPKAPELVEYAADFTGISAKFYRCSVCGRSGQDKELMTQHLKDHGGEA